MVFLTGFQLPVFAKGNSLRTWQVSASIAQAMGASNSGGRNR
jgi:hypothetical protein